MFSVAKLANIRVQLHEALFFEDIKYVKTVPKQCLLRWTLCISRKVWIYATSQNCVYPCLQKVLCNLWFKILKSESLRADLQVSICSRTHNWIRTRGLFFFYWCGLDWCGGNVKKPCVSFQHFFLFAKTNNKSVWTACSCAVILPHVRITLKASWNQTHSLPFWNLPNCYLMFGVISLWPNSMFC